MSLMRLVLAPLLYLLGVLLMLIGIITYLVSRVKLLLLGAWLGRPLDVLSGTDALVIFGSNPFFTLHETSGIVHGVLVLRGGVDLTKLGHRFQERVIDARNPGTGRRIHHRWRQLPVRRFGYFVWEEDVHFDVQRHVRMSVQKYSDQASLIKLIEKTVHEPLHEARALWDVLVIPKMAAAGADEETAVVLRAHHALADGANFLAVLYAVMDETSSSVTGLTKSGKMVQTAPLEKYHPLVSHLVNPKNKWSAEVIKNVLAMTFAAPWHVAQSLLQKPDRNSLHGPELSGRKLLALSSGLPFKMLKDVASALQCCISDVFIFCLTGAIQRSNDATPDRIGLSFDDHATLLIPMQLLPACSGWTQNGFTLVLTPYPLRGTSPRQRLQAIASITKATKLSAEPLINFVMTQGIYNHMPLVLAKNALPSMDFTSTATNVVGPSGDVTLLGLSVDKMFFFPPVHCIRGAVSVAIMTYNGTAHFGMTVDKAVAPDDDIAQRLANDCVIELKILHDLVKHETLTE